MPFMRPVGTRNIPDLGILYSLLINKNVNEFILVWCKVCRQFHVSLFMKARHNFADICILACQQIKVVDVRGFRVARTRGTTRRTQRFERRGLYGWDLYRNETRRWKPRDTGEHNTWQRETPSFTQVQGSRGEVKPLVPAFLYYDATPYEEYKALVTEL
jgi:hypothetical protein